MIWFIIGAVALGLAIPQTREAVGAALGIVVGLGMMLIGWAFHAVFLVITLAFGLWIIGAIWRAIT